MGCDIVKCAIACASETGVLEENLEWKLLLNGRKIFRRILGPKRVDIVHGELKQMMNWVT